MQHVVTAEEREREDAYKAEQDARNAPMAITTSNGGAGGLARLGLQAGEVAGIERAGTTPSARAGEGLNDGTG